MQIIVKGYTDKQIEVLAEYYSKLTSFLNRRDFLIGSTIFTASVPKVLSQNIAKKSHVVILGGGWGGLSAAKTIQSS